MSTASSPFADNADNALRLDTTAPTPALLEKKEVSAMAGSARKRKRGGASEEESSGPGLVRDAGGESLRKNGLGSKSVDAAKSKGGRGAVKKRTGDQVKMNATEAETGTGTGTPSATASSRHGPSIIFTGIEKDVEAVQAIGAVAVEDPSLATHMVTVLPLKRTPKLMVAINSGVQHLVSIAWLRDSAKAKRPIALETVKMRNKYYIKDVEKEKLWGFTVEDTLCRERGRVFAGLTFFIASDVYGSSAPPETEMRAIIQSGGGQLLSSVGWERELMEQEGVGGKERRGGDGGLQLVVVASSHSLHSVDNRGKSRQKGVLMGIPTVILERAKKLGAGKGDSGGRGIYSVELIFLSVLRQRLDFADNLLADFDGSSV